MDPRHENELRMPTLVLLASASCFSLAAALSVAVALPGWHWLAGFLSLASALPLLLMAWVSLRSLREPGTAGAAISGGRSMSARHLGVTEASGSGSGVHGRF